MPKRRVAAFRLVALSLCFIGGTPSQTTSGLATFEVASLKPVADPNLSPGDRAEILGQETILDRLPGLLPIRGRTLHLRNWSLRSLIAAAYRVRPRDIVGPDSIADRRFYLDATIPAAAAREKVNEMLRTLLADRLALKVHSEERELQGYAIMVAKNGPKLKSARQSLGDSSMGSAARSAEKTEQNVDDVQQRMDELRSEIKRTGTIKQDSTFRLRGSTIGQLANSAALLLQAPVQDQTGLKGRYDIEFKVPAPADGEDTPEHRVAVGLAKLGITLVRRKLPAKVLVVESVAAAPIPN